MSVVSRLGRHGMSVRGVVDDRAYFNRRAREERECANACEDRAAALAHSKMAEEYERRAQSLACSELRIVRD